MTGTTGSEASQHNEAARAEALANAEPMVRFEKVRKSFGSLTVLRDLDFTVRSGEKVAIVGPSGSGKTTILRVLMTLVKPDGGKVFVVEELDGHNSASVGEGLD